jgi:hypothetical protein
MAGRDSLPHFPAPEKGQPRPPTLSQPNDMYQQQPPYQQPYQQPPPVTGAYPSPGSPVGGYQVGPPGAGYGAAQQGYQQGYGQPGYNPNAARPVSTQPPQGVDPQLYNLFRAADTNGSGQLSERELSRALVNGDWTPFDPKTIKLMVKMFDVDQ